MSTGASILRLNPLTIQRMSVSGCLEEMLLRTNEGVGPHTETTIRYIQDLKKTHGIDYDSHGSYRFVEDETGGAV